MPKIISAKEGIERVRAGAQLIDVRTPREFHSGHVPGAKNIPHDELFQRLNELGPDKEIPIVLYCHIAPRAVFAQELLTGLGFKHVFAAAGYEEWRAINE